MRKAILVLFVVLDGLLFCAGGAPVPSFLLGNPATVAAQGHKEKIVPDVPYEPTPHQVVERMIELAGVTERDVVYDLGCGDGRIVIAAARLTGARGVGIDIDPVRIEEARRNARKAGQDHSVHFLQADLFRAPIEKATVVMLFLYPEVNLRLRPRLLSELQPGTRVVSHFHTMGEWKPDKFLRVGRHPLYYWIIPADINGGWLARPVKSSKSLSFPIRFDQQFQQVFGEISLPGLGRAAIGGRLTGNRVRFTFSLDRKFTFQGRVERGRLRGILQDGKGGRTELIVHRQGLQKP